VPAIPSTIPELPAAGIESIEALDGLLPDLWQMPLRRRDHPPSRWVNTDQDVPDNARYVTPTRAVWLPAPSPGPRTKVFVISTGPDS